MIKIKDANVYNRNYLIINETDEITPDHRGEKYDIIFIHKDTRNIEEWKRELDPCLSISGGYKGNIYIYGEEL